MRKLRTAIIGNGTEGTSLYNLFINDPGIEIVGVANISGDSPEMTGMKLNDILFSQTIEDLLVIDGLEIIFETTGNPDVSKKLHDLKKPGIQVVESSCLQLVEWLKNQNNTFEANLHSLVHTVDDGVQIVDEDGFITHINNSFINISGLSYEELIGYNIFEVMPESPTAKSFKQGKPLSGDNYYFKASSKEVSFHVSPILNKGIRCGFVAVYKELTDVKKLMNELRRSRAIIEDIYGKLSHHEKVPGLEDSDVMPIDHMEQTLLKQALTKFGYSVEGKKLAAKALNISLATLYNKLKKYQIS